MASRLDIFLSLTFLFLFLFSFLILFFYVLSFCSIFCSIILSLSFPPRFSTLPCSFSFSTLSAVFSSFQQFSPVGSFGFLSVRFLFLLCRILVSSFRFSLHSFFLVVSCADAHSRLVIFRFRSTCTLSPSSSFALTRSLRGAP